MKYHIVTPYKRFENLHPQIEMLKAQDANLAWDLLLDKHLPFHISVPGDWVRTFFFEPQQPFWQAWRHHLNAYIGIADIVANDRYLILNDDDAVEPGFFQKIDQHDGNLIICSMMRGHQTPPSGPLRSHPTDTLMADPANMRVGRVGCEQMICTGELFRQLKFANDVCADGMAIVDMVSRHPADYAAEAFVWFNYYEPGRWNKT